tara:strand:+ start:170 stop:367 length:198 start_codon:yes stop_codon:yes gene_type:complete
MQTQLLQKPNHGAYVLSTRLRNDAYKSIHNLITISGYKDTSSFVRDAVAMKVKELSKAVQELERV